ncbi:hypothetical protein BKA80DRAFT_286392 [Phyllosticta citrichinensis]
MAQGSDMASIQETSPVQSSLVCTSSAALHCTALHCPASPCLPTTVQSCQPPCVHPTTLCSGISRLAVGQGPALLTRPSRALTSTASPWSHAVHAQHARRSGFAATSRRPFEKSQSCSSAAARPASNQAGYNGEPPRCSISILQASPA